MVLHWSLLNLPGALKENRLSHGCQSPLAPQQARCRIWCQPSVSMWRFGPVWSCIGFMNAVPPVWMFIYITVLLCPENLASPTSFYMTIFLYIRKKKSARIRQCWELSNEGEVCLFNSRMFRAAFRSLVLSIPTPAFCCSVFFLTERTQTVFSNCRTLWTISSILYKYKIVFF